MHVCWDNCYIQKLVKCSLQYIVLIISYDTVSSLIEKNNKVPLTKGIILFFYSHFVGLPDLKIIGMIEKNK
jgi:hypothetical protein